MMDMTSRVLQTLDQAVTCLILALLLTGSVPLADSISERTRVYTRGIEFDFAGWTLEAAWDKLEQSALESPAYFSYSQRKYVVAEYIHVTDQILQAEAKVSLIYSDPQISDPKAASTGLRSQIEKLNHRQKALAPLAEAILQQQVSSALAELGLTSGGQPIPPVLYHVSPLPLSLIVSPRESIQTNANISLQPNMNVATQSALEERVDAALGTSSLVVPVGGIGTYPTMVMQTTDLNWQIEVIAHEWTHNYLTLRPLGLKYDVTPELRTMNETTASLAGKEIGSMVLQRYYPERLQGHIPNLETASLSGPLASASPRQAIDFRAEMHTTRLRVDELLAAGKVEEAEAYMEERRRFFWDNGYALRKLNQAYFAFYGAYADVPGGAAGEDPVGPTVVALRAKSASLADFLNRIAWMTSFEELQAAVQAP